MRDGTAQIEGLHPRRYMMLLELSKAIASHRDVSGLFHEIAGQLRDFIEFEYLGLRLHDDSRGVMQLLISEPRDTSFQEGPNEVSVDGSISGWVWRTRQPLIIHDLDRETRFPNCETPGAKYPAKSFCGLPLTTAHRQVGVLVFASDKTGTYDSLDLQFAQLVAGQIALGVNDALSYETSQPYQQQLTRERDSLRLLLDVNNAVVSHLDLRELLAATTSCLHKVMQFAYITLSLYDPESNSLRIRLLDFPVGRGLIHEEIEVPLEITPAGLAFTTRKPVLLGSIDKGRFPSRIADLLIAEGVKSVCSVPLISHGKALGALNVGSLRENEFTQEDAVLLGQVANQIAIAVENALAFHQIDVLKKKLEDEKLYLEEEIRTEYNFEEIIGHSPALKRALQEVETVAPTDSNVLIYGETGTGKELIARAIHNLSPRREHTLVKVNCAAIPTGLLESEMFGHEKGAFTGAVEQRKGRFELADRGTIFLDEVEDISLELQPKLLRVLQEQEFERLGSSRTMHVDVRVVAATNTDLAQMVTDKKFRGDLYYRLNVFPVSLPALRERPEDIPLLVHFFAQKFAKQMQKRIGRIPADAMAELIGYAWPGNIRELQNLVERAVILSRGTILEIPLAELKRAAEITTDFTGAPSTLKALEREHILRVLRESNWVVSGPAGAAARLGLKRTTLNHRMRKLGIARPKPETS